MPLLTEAYEARFDPLSSPHYLSYAKRPHNTLDLFDEEYNCSLDQSTFATAINKQPLAVSYMLDNGETVLIDAKLGHRQLTQEALHLVKDQIIELLPTPTEKVQKHKLYIPYIALESLGIQANDSTGIVKAYNEKTERVIVRTKSKGQIHRTTTRLRFYPVRSTPANFHHHAEDVETFVMNFGSKKQPAIAINDDENAIENISISEASLKRWLLMGEWDKCIKRHDTAEQLRLSEVRQRHGLGIHHRQLREYSGSAHLYDLMRYGVIQITGSYRSKFDKAVKRADLFDEIGAYSFSSMSAERLAKIPTLVSMKQHRQDKIKCVQIVRQHRNAMRQRVKTASNGDHRAIIKNHFHELGRAINEVNEGLTYLTGNFVDTATPSTPQRLSTARFTLALQSRTLSSLNSLERQLLNNHARGVAASNPTALTLNSRVYIDSLETILNDVAYVATRAAMFVSTLEDLIVAIHAGNGDQEQLWFDWLAKHNPEATHRITFINQWKASAESMTRQLTEKVRLINKVAHEFQHMERTIKSSLRSTESVTLRKMSTNNLFSFLAEVA